MGGILELDTSGRVHGFAGSGRFPRDYREWEDLTPFQQGYVEALFAEVPPALVPNGDPETGESWDEEDPRGFSDLSPEALAMILADCDRQALVYTDRTPDQTDGRIFWSGRQHNVLRSRGFPPLTPYLSDEGRVCLKVASPSSSQMETK